MSIINSSTVSQKAAAAGDKPPLTPEQVMEQLRAMKEQIPGFVLEPNERELRRLRAAARVDIQLTREAATVIGGAEAVQNAIGNTPAELREAESAWSQWVTVEGEFRSILRGLSAANVVRRYQLARAVRHAYRIGRTLTEQEEYAQLLPHIETMFRVKNRKRAKAALSPDDAVKK
ncbi:MAG TPA: hypothetical protein VF266_17090 [Thermoanaerobaculia bacterium]